MLKFTCENSQVNFHIISHMHMMKILKIIHDLTFENSHVPKLHVSFTRVNPLGFFVRVTLLMYKKIISNTKL